MKKQRSGLVWFDVERLERLMLGKGLSKGELAQKAGMSRGAVTNVFKGKGCFPNSAKRLADALGTSVPELVQTGHQADGAPGAFAIPGTQEWDLVDYLGPWRPASNGLQFRVCKMRHKADPKQWGRGKFYDLLGVPADQRDRIRHYLTRHFQVCGRVSSHEHVAENLSCVPLTGREGWWVVDRWVDGKMLSEHLALGPWPSDEVILLLTQIGKGLMALHEAGVVFRELAPSRVLIAGRTSRAVLTDFELAKLLEEAPSVSAAWPEDPYRAPEVESGQATDQADSYSWARVAVHVTAGFLPAAGKEKEVLGKLPQALRTLVPACLSPSYLRRPHVRDIMTALQSSSPFSRARS